MALNVPRVLRQRIGFRAVVVLTCVAIALWVSAAFAFDAKTMFLPGETSVGHYLIEGSCASCHEGFKPVSNETCNRCHEAELAADLHGRKKFMDPRWAGELAKLEVLTCTTCHNEHVHMFGRGVHLQPDLCMTCHQGIIAGDLKSHDGFAPDGCWTAGCHNFHDQRAIEAGFLRQHLDEPPMLPVQQVGDRPFAPEIDAAPAPDLQQEFLGGGA